MSLQTEETQKVLLIDIDDTCVDSLSGFIKWLSKQQRLKNVVGNKITDRDNLGDFLNVPDQLAELWTKEFNEQSWEWGALLPYADSQKVLPNLVRQGWYIIAYSRSANQYHRVILRRANLELLFPGVFSEIHIAALESNLYPAFLEHTDAVCVTASISTAMHAVAAGHVTYLLEQPWSRDFTNFGVRKFNTWAEINNALIKQYV